MGENDVADVATDEAELDRPADVDAVRMSFGDHLEELRARMILGLVGLALAMTVSLIFADDILAFLYRPLLVVQDAHGLRTALLALAPPDAFVAYLKMGLLSGLVMAMPWLVYQGWLFVAAGLYRHERRFVKLFGPVSAGLFAVGVAFLYYVVLPIVLNFLVTFNMGMKLPSLERHGISRVLFGKNPAADAGSVGRVAAGDLPVVPVVEKAPVNAPNGAMWIDAGRRRLFFKSNDDVLSAPLERGQGAGVVRSEFGLSDYVSFVLSLALAFGIAFELPVAVVFLAMTGIVSTETLGKGRRYVVLVIFILSALLTPPDVISQVLLAVPMIGLFEGGLIAARMVEGGRSAV
ncbi:MAG: twin-arginine translocase subunit TatC [Phycisphaerae bacterium]